MTTRDLGRGAMARPPDGGFHGGPIGSRPPAMPPRCTGQCSERPGDHWHAVNHIEATEARLREAERLLRLLADVVEKRNASRLVVDTDRIRGDYGKVYDEHIGTMAEDAKAERRAVKEVRAFLRAAAGDGEGGQ